MKTTHFVLVLFAVIFTLTSNAQAPEKINYQAVARNAAGQIIANQPVGVRFTIREGSSSGTILYQETHTDTTNQFGLFTSLIGTGTPTTGTFSSVNWSSGDKFLDVDLDVNGGTAYTSMGSSQLVSVPFALASADNKWSETTGGIYCNSSGNVGIGITAPTSKLYVMSAASTIATFRSSGAVSGNIFIGNSTTGGYIGYNSTHNAFVVTAGGSTDLGLYTGTAAKQFITLKNNTSRIGLFTENPTRELDIHKNSIGFGDGTNSGKFLYFRHGGTDTASRIYCTPAAVGIYMPADGTMYPDNVGMLISRSSKALYPATNGDIALGLSGQRWKEVWAVNGTIQTSDERMKKNIQDISYGLETIMKLRPVTYEWKDGVNGSNKNIGFLAQEVQQVLPEAVVYAKMTDAEKRELEALGLPIPGQTDNYGIKYAELIPVLTKAIQEQQILIQELKSEIQLLKSK